MDELIKQLTDRLGIDSATAKGVTGKAMGMIKENIDDSTFSKLASSLPGLESLIQSENDGESADAGGGMLGSLAGMASKMLGGSTGNSLELGTALAAKGLPLEKLGEFVTMLVQFIKEHAGEQVLDQVLARFPMLKGVLDQGK
ncbi:hypothetical protein Pla52o_11380 [Novipirellula galeiformis]|uniref:DUF2780 domain-containing protein n=1 Tax=Novipirellula galeiformis TaxID=2528004 RepID=A0A5C6CMP6_9BACT|nr:DUF2780 domain-containing protein [Novipirellula galeiformis]TWU24847.1 hypothetical protein Pla52o_11380 [Novipirellula galeiformis]